MEGQLMQELEQVEAMFVDKISDNMKTFGVSTTVGRVLGIIYMEREAMTLDDLAEETGMSKMRMSQVMREMIHLHIAEKTFQKGVRKDLYTVEDNYYQTFISLFTTNWKDAISKSTQFKRKIVIKLEEIKQKTNLSDEEKSKIETLERELILWTEYYDWLAKLVHFFESGEIFQYVPK